MSVNQRHVGGEPAGDARREGAGSVPHRELFEPASSATTESGVAASDGQSSVARHLMELYSITVAVGLAACIEGIITSSPDGGTDVQWTAAPLLIVFLVTLVPFYHGALQHLDQCWRKPRATASPWWLILFDFGALLMQAGLFFALARFLQSPESFATCLLLLLGVDCAWALIFWVGAPEQPNELGRTHRLRASLRAFYASFGRTDPRAKAEKEPELSWMWLNLHAIPVFSVILALHVNWPMPGSLFAWLVAVFAVARTAADYRTSRTFYFRGMAI